MSNYYEEQLNKLHTKSQLSLKVFDSEGNSTNVLDVNIESLSIIVSFLEAYVHGSDGH